MRDLHRHQRASPFTAVPAVGSGHPSLRLPDPVPAVPALSTPGFSKRTYFPRKPMAAASTDFDAPSDDEDHHAQDEALVVAATQAGAPRPAPVVYPSTMNVRGQPRPQSQSLPSSPPAPRPAPRPRICFLCQGADHWGDQCPHREAAVEAVQAKTSRLPTALSTILDDASASAMDYAYKSREERGEWENGHHEFDEYEEDYAQQEFASCMNLLPVSQFLPFPCPSMSDQEQAIAAERTAIFNAFPDPLLRAASYVQDVAVELQHMESGTDVAVDYAPGSRLLCNDIRISSLNSSTPQLLNSYPFDLRPVVATCVLLPPGSEDIVLISSAAVSARTRNALPLGWKSPAPAHLQARRAAPSSPPLLAAVVEDSDSSLPPFPLRSFTAAAKPLTWSAVADPPPASESIVTAPQVAASTPAATSTSVGRLINTHTAAATIYPNPAWRPPAAPPHVAHVIRTLTLGISKRTSLDYLLQPLDRLAATVGFIDKGVRHVAPRAFLDSGATICLISFAYAMKVGLDIYSTDVKLATSVLSNQTVFGTTGPLILQFGMPPYSVDIPTIFLVTLDMSQMYDLLISNDASHIFRGTTSNATQSLTLIRPDGVNVVVPLRPLP